MKLLTALYAKIKSLLNAVFRFPVTFVFICVIAALNAISIENSSADFFKLELSLTLGSFVYAVLQVFFEKNLNKIIYRILFIVAAVAATTGYYFLVMQYKTVGMETLLRTIIALFAMLILFILIPSIKSKTSFNNTFMIFFKALFTSAFFSAIIWGGISLIILAINTLLFKVNSNIYTHVINIVWVVFAPTFFLSLFPSFTQSDENKLKIEKASQCPKFLSALVSFVLVPLTGVYSVILIIYIIKSIVTSFPTNNILDPLILNYETSFWKNNLLEPLILSYTVAIIILYILASDINNRFAIFFRAVFPKILVPVVLFQLVSSVINTFDSGVTQMRYFVLIYGLYAIIAGVLLSFLPVRKNGIIAIVIIIFSIISICPPTDVFTVSRISQISLLEGTLTQDNMLVDNKLVPKNSISKEDKNKIIGAMQSLNDIEYLKNLKWLPPNFNLYNDFQSQFGFPYDRSSTPQDNISSVFFQIESSQPLPVRGYDFIKQVNVYFSGSAQSNKICSFTVSNATYSLNQDISSTSYIIKISDNSGSTVISYDLKPALGSLAKNNAGQKNTIPVSQMTFTIENSKAKMAFIIDNANISTGTGQDNTNATVEVLFSIK